MSIINAINCGSDTMNTGLGSCVFNPKEFVGSVLVPTGTKIMQSDIDGAGGLSNYLTSMLNHDDKEKRFFLIGNFEEIEDNSEDSNTETFGYGNERILREGQYRMTFRFIKGGKCLHTAIRTFAGQEDAYDVLFIDSQMAVLGTRVVEEGAVGIGGYSLSQIYVPKMTFADGSTMVGYRITYSLSDESEMNDRFAFVLPLDADKSSMGRLKGIIDVMIVTEAEITGGIVKARLTTGCGSTNLVDLFSDELSADDAWSITGVGGADIPITSFTVVTDGSGSYLSILLDTVDPAYPDSDGIVTVSLAKPSELSAIDIESPNGSLMESNKVRIKVA